MLKNKTWSKPSRRILTSMVIVVTIITCIGTFWSITRGDEKHSSVPTHVCIIVLDAFRPEYFNLTATPNLTSLMGSGIYYDRAWVGHLINNTPPGHATLATGVFPSKHGVPAFWWKDPKSLQVARPTTIDKVESGELTNLIANSKVPTLVGRLKEKMPNLKAASIASGKFYAAASMAMGCDYTVFAPGDRDSGQKKLEERSGVEDDLSVGYIKGMEPPSGVLKDGSLRRKAYGAIGTANTWTTDVALSLFRASAIPQVLFVNYSEADGFGHTSGGLANPKRMAKVVSEMDVQVGRLVNAYRKAGIWDQTLFVVTSDHAIIANDKNMSLQPITKIIKDAGTEVVGSLVPPHIWIADASKAPEIAVKMAESKLSGLSHVYYKRKTQAGGYEYVPVNGGKETPANLDAAYRYLGSTYAGPKSPDILAIMEENTLEGSAPLSSRGAHGSLSWFTQHVPLVLSGPGIREAAISHSPVRLADIAPTVLAAFGVTPKDMDGVIIADAFKHPEKKWLDAFSQIMPKMRRFQLAIVEESEKDQWQALVKGNR